MNRLILIIIFLQLREARKLEQAMNPHYLKTNNDITSDIPVAEIESVPLKIQGIPYLRFISIFFWLFKKKLAY